MSDRIKWRFTPPCGGATQPPGTGPAGGRISIHAPRVGGDYEYINEIMDIAISIHAPRVGGDDLNAARILTHRAFQSTPPVWGATTGIESDSTRA
ncbi:hypothetical protein [Intestinimonas butyriciproducens]|uniref:hypothetical protein n=1 Tax=Intestinimonas butyriciproducens TaxID=1297617 RepID=UPI003F63BBD3